MAVGLGKRGLMTACIVAVEAAHLCGIGVHSGTSPVTKVPSDATQSLPSRPRWAAIWYAQESLLPRMPGFPGHIKAGPSAGRSLPGAHEWVGASCLYKDNSGIHNLLVWK